jgi:DNA mismatch endonuclease, patch repair protein
MDTEGNVNIYGIIIQNVSVRNIKKVNTMDSFGGKTRSEIMSKIHSKNNKTTELKLIEYFKKNNIKGWRRNYKIKGKPDFVFQKLRIAIFVDGCFWHGHDCRNTRPTSNSEYWNKKISHNMQHDYEITLYLQKLGWTVIRIWECELKQKNIKRLEDKLSILYTILNLRGN